MRFRIELSGGQRQRVALARALAAHPGAILLDEPFGALDVISRVDLQNAFDDVRRHLVLTALLVTHDLGEAARLADEIVVMRRGRIEQRGSATDLLRQPATEYVVTLVEAPARRPRGWARTGCGDRDRARSLSRSYGASGLLRGLDPKSAPSHPIVVASKPFGESYLLAEMFAQLLEIRGIRVERRPGLGSTDILFDALRSGAIDVYPEYTGTGLLAILHDTLTDALATASPHAAYDRVAREFETPIRHALAAPAGLSEHGCHSGAARYGRAALLAHVSRSGPGERATPSRVQQRISLDVPTVSWVSDRVYGIRPRAVRSLAPAVKYQALAAGAVDVIDGYSDRRAPRTLRSGNPRGRPASLPPYEAAALVGPRVAAERTDALVRRSRSSPGAWMRVGMRALNERIEVGHVDVRTVAADALAALGLAGRTDRGTRIRAMRRRRLGCYATSGTDRGHIGELVVRASRARGDRPRLCGAGCGAGRPGTATGGRPPSRSFARSGPGRDGAQHRAARVHDPRVGDRGRQRSSPSGSMLCIRSRGARTRGCGMRTPDAVEAAEALGATA